MCEVFPLVVSDWVIMASMGVGIFSDRCTCVNGTGYQSTTN